MVRMRKDRATFRVLMGQLSEKRSMGSPRSGEWIRVAAFGIRDNIDGTGTDGIKKGGCRGFGLSSTVWPIPCWFNL